MKDYLVRAMTNTGNICAFACITSHLVQEICQQHDTCPTATVALGRALTGGALMGALLQDDQRLALKFEGNGPLRKILVEADSAGHVRGYVGVPQVNLPLKQGAFDVVSAVGRAGFLTVTKDLCLKEPYKGVVQLCSSEIAEDLAYYFAESEQIPSAVGAGVFVEASGKVTTAGGFLVQSLPPADKGLIEDLTRYIGQMPPITELLRRGATVEGVLEQLFQDIPLKELDTQPLAFKCTCSKQRMERALVALGVDDLTEMSLDPNPTEVHCEFCRVRYSFRPEEIKRLADNIQ